ncbi:MAG: phosphatidate cytidylyltransferase [Alphaproteobacteria bacterium]|nr:phosphatidate cytidylyltransferase [Alphaproteobacteria bacterium]
MMTASENPAIKPESGLKTRVKSALIFAPCVLFILYMGGYAFSIMIAAAALIGAFEWTRMVTTGLHAPRLLSRLSAFVAGLAVLAAGFVQRADGMVDNPVIPLFLLLALCCVIFAYNFYHNGPRIGRVLGGVVYIGFALDVMIWVRNGSEYGLYNMLTLLSIVWASDCFAYFAGRAIGGPRLAPKISPKKTWAGFFGSSVGAGVVAAGLACPWLTAHAGVQTVGHWGPLAYGAVGFVLAMFGQAGDLLISYFKRHYGVKDTGDLIPGHGGILDRIDALLLVSLLFGGIIAVAG